MPDERTLSDRLAELRDLVDRGTYLSLPRAEALLWIDLALAAEHLRSIDRELHTSGSSAFWSALADMYDWLDTLHACLRGEG